MQTLSISTGNWLLYQILCWSFAFARLLGSCCPWTINPCRMYLASCQRQNAKYFKCAGRIVQTLVFGSKVLKMLLIHTEIFYGLQGSSDWRLSSQCDHTNCWSSKSNYFILICLSSVSLELSTFFAFHLKKLYFDHQEHLFNSYFFGLNSWRKHHNIFWISVFLLL